jgi:mevalonate kinase
MRNVYHAKLLLWGEYAIVAGGEGLALPLTGFTACWREHGIGEDWARSQAGLYKLLGYVQAVSDLAPRYDTQSWAADLAAGAWIDSDIPQGYGAGSSGAVVAAVYERYALQKASKADELQRELADLENCFHAASSGLDPLVIYSEKAIHLRAQYPQFIDDLPAACLPTYLIDTGLSRSTAPLVAHFRGLCAEEDFRLKHLPLYLELTQKCIRAWLQADKDELWANLRALSAWQLRYMSTMIPSNLRKTWGYGLESGQYALKLCGAGGGGFLLGFGELAPNTQLKKLY